MPNYRIRAAATASKYVGEVEADNEEEAEDKAFESFDCNIRGNCSNDFDIDGTHIEVELVEGDEHGQA